MAVPPEIKNHPDYASGYWDAMDGVPILDDATSEYRAGWEAADRTKALLESHGFTKTGPREYGKAMTLPPSPLTNRGE